MTIVFLIDVARPVGRGRHSDRNLKSTRCQVPSHLTPVHDLHRLRLDLCLHDLHWLSLSHVCLDHGIQLLGTGRMMAGLHLLAGGLLSVHPCATWWIQDPTCGICLKQVMKCSHKVVKLYSVITNTSTVLNTFIELSDYMLYPYLTVVCNRQSPTKSAV